MKRHEMQDLVYNSGLRGAAQGVYVAIVLHTDEGGTCWPSITRLARCAGCSRKQAHAVLERLIRDGFIARDGRVFRVLPLPETVTSGDSVTSGDTFVTVTSGDTGVTSGNSGCNLTSHRIVKKGQEGVERASAPPAPDLFPDQSPKADLEPKRRSAPKPKKTACPWPTVGAMLADAEVMRLAVEKGMRNGTVNAQAAQFLAHHDEKGSRFVDWYRAWGVTWCQRWADWGAKQSHAPATAISPEAAAKRLSGPLLYRVKDYFCERQQLDGTWRRVDNTPADLMQRFSDRTVEFDWTECSPARAAELKAELAAAKGEAA